MVLVWKRFKTESATEAPLPPRTYLPPLSVPAQSVGAVGPVIAASRGAASSAEIGRDGMAGSFHPAAVVFEDRASAMVSRGAPGVEAQPGVRGSPEFDPG